ncbi:PREDICTED: low-density lipoprotein receptor-related protein 4-like, partial [Branchiostoma belcheri]|uniref:Low-density lipoprotein receptor-related protein 4-like n=1 Tax=Branchiostoma belcheri TaxID=7741 RepID=A0A6P4ZGJ1_BRABE
MRRGGVACSSGGLAKTCVVVFLLSAVGKLDASLLVTNGTHIIDYDISTNRQTVLPVSEPGGIVALAVDVGGQRLYYTNAETGGIVRCGLDGSNQHAVVNTDVTQPTGIAYDWVSGLVYWTDEGRGTVEVAQGDGSNRKTLISGQLFPRGIAVDPISGYLFWGNQGDFTIRRARLDGSDVETLHNTGLVWPNELVVDFPNSRLYWIEGYFGYIGSSALDGTDRTIVANVSSGYVLFGLALQDDTLYYTSWEGKLFSVDQNSGEQSEVMEAEGEQLLGLVSVHPSRQPAGSNPCQTDNGDCSHLCLPTAPDSRICTCPDDGGLAIGKDNKTCEEPGQFLLYAKADEGQIMMLTVDLSMAARPVLLDQGVRPVAVAYDPIEQRVYWSDVVTHTINRVFLNGTGSEAFMDGTNGIASVEGLAVDWQNRRLYFSNLGLHYTGVSWGRVEMVGLDRTGHRRLLEGRVGKPRSIVLDMQARHMYITDWGEEPKILRADLDGRDPQTIMSSEMENPNGLAISDGKLYWVDSHVKSGVNSTGTLEQAELDGTNREQLLQDVPFHVPFGLAVQGSTVYWTAWGQDGTGAVFQGNSGTGDHRVVVGGLGDPMAVTICNKSYATPEEPNPCAGHDCSHICVPTAGSYRCMCPNTGGLGLGSDGKSCVEPQQFLLVADLTEIRMVPLDTPDRYPYPIIQVHDLYSNIAAVTYDPETKMVYFSDVGCRSILRAYLNGTGLQVVHRDTGVSDGMTIDPMDRYLYWTDGERGTIERMALNGSEEDTHEVVLQGLDRPRAIVVISDTNYMYWTDWGESPSVKRASMEVNATDVQNLVEGDLSWPNGLVVDSNEGKLYIGDGNNTKIEAALLDGSDRQLILDESSGHVYGLAKIGDVLLWSDWAGQSVKMMTLGSDEIQVLTDGLMRPSELHSSNITDGLLTPTTHVSTTTTAATTLAITTTQVTTPVPTTAVTTPVITTRVTTPVPTTTVTTPVITTEVTTPAPITTTTTATTPVITTEVTTPVPTTTATTPVITTEVTTPVPTTTATTPV